MKTRVARFFLALIAVVILLFIGFWTLFILSFSGENVYSVISIVFFVVLIVRIIAWVISDKHKKIANYLLLFVIGALALSSGIYEMHKSYVNSIPEVGNGDFDLQIYQPFSENTLAVYLNEESTLRIHDNLPRIDGATALYPLYSAFVQAVYPEKKYSLYDSEVQGGTTPKAFSHLVEGKVDIIFCAAPSPEQIIYAEQNGKTFKMIPIGKEAFVFFVNAENPIKNITSQQIKDIYSGKIINWKDVSNIKKGKIRAFQRPVGSGSQTMLERIMNETPLMIPPKVDRVGGMGGIIEETASYKNYSNAIGYTFLFFATGMVKNKQIALLSINGVYPSHQTILDGTYPFTGDFYAITTSDNKNPNVDLFIEWILSSQGQALVEKTGYVAIKKPTVN